MDSTSEKVCRDLLKKLHKETLLFKEKVGFISGTDEFLYITLRGWKTS